MSDEKEHQGVLELAGVLLALRPSRLTRVREAALGTLTGLTVGCGNASDGHVSMPS